MSDGDPTINFENLVDTVILVQGLLNVSHKRPLPGIEINLFTEKQYKTFTIVLVQGLLIWHERGRCFPGILNPSFVFPWKPRAILVERLTQETKVGVAKLNTGNRTPTFHVTEKQTAFQ